MTARPSLGFVLFVHDEEDLVEPAVLRSLQALEADFDDFEIVLVDDGSRDRTGEVMDRLAAEHPRVRVLHDFVNLGIGVSIQRGLLAVTKDLAVYDGVDLPLAPEDLGALADQMHRCDVLVLERTSFAGYTSWRRITSEINRWMLRLLFGAPHRDLNYTQVFRRSVLPLVQPLARSPAFTAPEMILRAHRMGLRVESAPAAYHARPKGTGSLGRPHDILWSLYDMARYRLRAWGSTNRRSR